MASKLTIGQHINLARDRKNMSVKKLAEKSGVAEGTLCSWIYKGATPTIFLLICVADALDISLDELVGRTVPRK